MPIPQAANKSDDFIDRTANPATVSDNGTVAARTMLDLFASVGATRFNVSWINRDHKPRRPRTLRKTLQSLGGPLPHADNDDWLDAVHIDGISPADLDRILPALLDTSIAEWLNLIIRPFGSNVMFIQFDDLTAEKLPSLAPAMFLIFETSPGSFQAWCAIPGEHNRELARRGKRGVHSDKSASGATRIAGSFNFKRKYAPNYPRITIVNAQPGRTTSVDELERMGLLAPPEEFTPLPAPRPLAVSSRKWPSYAKALDGAPRNRVGNGPDRSTADFWWCFLAIQWGFSIEQTAEELLVVSEKARLMEDRSKGYAIMTARNAAIAVDKRQCQSRHRD